MRQYEFSEVPKTLTNKFKSIADLYDKYKDDRETSLIKYLNYMQMSGKFLVKRSLW